MIRASAERVTVKLLPVASFNVPCHQAVSRRLRMGQRSPVVEIVPEGAILIVGNIICCKISLEYWPLTIIL